MYNSKFLPNHNVANGCQTTNFCQLFYNMYVLKIIFIILGSYISTIFGLWSHIWAVTDEDDFLLCGVYNALIFGNIDGFYLLFIFIHNKWFC